MAIVYRDACHTTFNIIWSVHNEMILESLIGLVMNLMVADNASGQNVTRAIMLAKEIHKDVEKKEEIKKEGETNDIHRE